jgi:3-oxoacyl-[acyl-carrier-protein] synthase-3
MAASQNVGIYGVGRYLPPAIRTNDWWPESVVASWRERRSTQAFGSVIKEKDPSAQDALPITEGVQRVLSELSAGRDDIFQGMRARRVMSEGMSPSDMEIAAAQDAIAKSNVEPRDIDLILTYSPCPDFLCVPNACIVHEGLGLSQKCFTMAADGAGNSFLLQLSLADQAIRAGRARIALIIQSTAMSRLLHVEEQFSLIFGDCATAAIIGPVKAGRGILGSAHRTDGSLSRTAVCDVLGRHWYEEGRNVFHVDDPLQARKMLLAIPDLSRQVIHEALLEAGLLPADISFYACHQGATWTRSVTQSYCELDNAKSVDTFSWTGNLMGSNIPMMLTEGRESGLLNDGDTVAMFSGGSGMTWSATVLRWGR